MIVETRTMNFIGGVRVGKGLFAIGGVQRVRADITLTLTASAIHFEPHWSTAVMFRFGASPTATLATSLRLLTSITLTQFEPAHATYT